MIFLSCIHQYKEPNSFRILCQPSPLTMIICNRLITIPNNVCYGFCFVYRQTFWRHFKAVWQHELIQIQFSFALLQPVSDLLMTVWTTQIPFYFFNKCDIWICVSRSNTHRIFQMWPVPVHKKGLLFGTFCSTENNRFWFYLRQCTNILCTFGQLKSRKILRK